MSAGAVTLLDRKFRPTIVLNTIKCVYGKDVPDKTWGNWRKWADIVAERLPGYTLPDPERRTYSFQQFCALYAIAVIRRKHREDPCIKKFPRLVEKQVRQLAESPDVQGQLAGLIDMIDARYVIGADAVKALYVIEGIDVSLRTVQRNVPAFSINKLYELDYLKRFVSGRKTA